jgi:hypothetical protein
MDSNSSSPFMGLQLSVDASDAQETPGTTTPAKSIRPVALVGSEFESDHSTDSVAPRGTVVGQGMSTFVATSETSKQAGNLKYSLPILDVHGGGSEAQEVDDIISRFPGS